MVWMAPAIKQVEHAEGKVMIVRHLSFLGKLAVKLLVGKEETETVVFQNSGVVCLTGDSGSAWRLIWTIVPDVTRRTKTCRCIVKSDCYTAGE